MLGTLCSCCRQDKSSITPFNLRCGRVKFVVIVSEYKGFLHFRSEHVSGGSTRRFLIGGDIDQSDTPITGCLCSGYGCMFNCSSGKSVRGVHGCFRMFGTGMGSVCSTFPSGRSVGTICTFCRRSRSFVIKTVRGSSL